MFSSINARAILPVACAVTGFVIACCVLLYSLIKTDLVKREVLHAADLADTVITSTRYAMLKDDRDMLGNIIRSVGDEQLVEHVRIFNKKGLIMFSHSPAEIDRFIDKSAAGCTECHADREPKRHLGTMEQARQFTNSAGNAVLAITKPIYNQPDCWNAACHVHSSDTALLGTLDIGVSQASLQETLGMLRIRMISFTAMVLILTVGAVCALLYRQVFLPIRRLVAFTERAGGANLERHFPEVTGEVAHLARAFHGMACRLRDFEHGHIRPSEAGEAAKVVKPSEAGPFGD